MDKESLGRGVVIWFVDVEMVADALSRAIGLTIPNARIRILTRPEMALGLLENGASHPDLLITTFYFDGQCQTGLWLIEQVRKIAPGVPAILMSGFDLEHVRGIVEDWREKPDQVIPKPLGHLADLLEPVQHLLHGRVREPAPASLPAVAGRTAALACPAPVCRQRPLALFAGPRHYLPLLKHYLGRDLNLPRFQRGYDWEHFETPECAWEALETAIEQPEALVTDFYFSGGHTNGLKLIRHARSRFPGIWTVLASDLPELHLRRVMEGTGIHADRLFQYPEKNFSPLVFSSFAG